ncbi:hypothetical protein, partial [Citrobacter freundii]|uniref:hypothetical protein n=1 Tax=Citrobacter freundii TaxID=546 RepID=UPI001BD133E8
GLAIDQIAQSGLSSLSVIYYSAQLFSLPTNKRDLMICAGVFEAGATMKTPARNFLCSQIASSNVFAETSSSENGRTVDSRR